MIKTITKLLLFLSTFCLCYNCAPSEPQAVNGVYNVRDFGAVGDGVADDTAAIQRAIDYITEHNGGTLFFPIGKYRLATIQSSSDGMQAHLFIRDRQREEDAERNTIMIRLRGQSAVNTSCAYANHSGEDKYPVWENGSVLFSDVFRI